MRLACESDSTSMLKQQLMTYQRIWPCWCRRPRLHWQLGCRLCKSWHVHPASIPDQCLDDLSVQCYCHALQPAEIFWTPLSPG